MWRRTCVVLIFASACATDTSVPRAVDLPRGVLVGDDDGLPPALVKPDDRPSLACNGVYVECAMRGDVTRCWCSDVRRRR